MTRMAHSSSMCRSADGRRDHPHQVVRMTHPSPAYPAAAGRRFPHASSRSVAGGDACALGSAVNRELVRKAVVVTTARCGRTWPATPARRKSGATTAVITELARATRVTSAKTALEPGRGGQPSIYGPLCGWPSGRGQQSRAVPHPLTGDDRERSDERNATLPPLRHARPSFPRREDHWHFYSLPEIRAM
jgi:hypothetical protein